MRAMRRVILVIFASLLLVWNSGELLVAGERTNIRGVAMARTQVAVARGLDAIGTNPANLAVVDEATVIVGLLPVAIRLGNNVVSYDLYSKYFDGIQTDSGRVGVNLIDADKRDILSRFDTEMGEGMIDVEARMLGVAVNLQSIGSFAFTMTDRIAGGIVIPRPYVEFLFYGNPPGSVYDFKDSRTSVAWTREYALSYARNLPELPFLKSWRGGVSLKLIQGLSYFGVERFDAQLATSPVGTLDGRVDVFTRAAGFDPTVKNFGKNFTLFPAPGGVGYGLDFGVTGELNEFFSAGLSVTDLGATEWRRNLRENIGNRAIRLDNVLDQAQRDSLNNMLRGQSREGSPFSTQLPTTLRIGIAVELHKLPMVQQLIDGELIVAADYTQGLVTTAGGTVLARGSCGVEYRPWSVLLLRSGLSLGGVEGVSVAFGFGVHFGAFTLDLATENLGWIFAPSTARHGSMAAGMCVRF
jgi:hypothetical protein